MPWEAAFFYPIGDFFGLEAATSLLRCFARHAAIEAGEPNLFHELEVATRNFEPDDDWSAQWWEVPFTAVMHGLCAAYAEIPGVPHRLEILEATENVDQLRAALEEGGVATDADPFEIARRNRDRLANVLSDVHDLYRTWVELTDLSSSAPVRPQPQTDLDPGAYLQHWSEVELLHRAFQSIADSGFVDACEGCASLDDIRDRLGLDPDAVEARRRERREQAREEERRRRTFDVAGFSFEVGTTSYGELFQYLNGLDAPVGPRASRDTFTSLTPPLPRRSRGAGGTGGNASNRRPSAGHREYRDLVGIVGEIHAYRYLRHEFGIGSVTPDSWVSEIRLQVLPLVAGEPENSNDGHGYDFQFSHRGRRWHVEVKSTTGDDPQFGLGISEIEAATRLARKRGGRWRILRVRNALSVQPEFDWLPNPFEEGFRQLFRLHRGEMLVSYRRRRS